MVLVGISVRVLVVDVGVVVISIAVVVTQIAFVIVWTMVSVLYLVAMFDRKQVTVV